MSKAIHRRMDRIVQLKNPQPGGSRYTTRRAAEGLVARGRASWVGAMIEILPERIQEQLATAERERRDAAQVDAGIDRWRGGRVFWNGSDRRDGAQHLPGAVRS